jgi:hypothetical protein
MSVNSNFIMVSEKIPFNNSKTSQFSYDHIQRLEYAIKNYDHSARSKDDPLLFDISNKNLDKKILKLYKEMRFQLEDQNEIKEKEEKDGYAFFDEQEDKDMLREHLLRNKPDAYMMFNTSFKVARYLYGFVSNGRCLKCPQCDRIPARTDVIEQLVSRVFPLRVFDHTILPGCVIGVIVDYL